MRVLIAPVEIAGQMQIIAEALRNQGIQAAAVSHDQTNYLGIVNDISLGLTDKHGPVRRLVSKFVFFIQAAANYDIFHFFFGRSLLPGRFDLPVLKLLGKKIVCHFHGTDIRNPAVLYHRSALARGEIFGDQPGPPLSLDAQQENLRIWRKYAHAILVSTPDLQSIVPEAILIPQTLPLHQWPFDPQQQQDLWGQQPVRIAHAPTDRAKKGTKSVIEAIHNLQTRGFPVELVLVEGEPNHQARRIYQSCHMGVDQLLVGSVSTFAVELMALGKPVLSYISSDLQEAQPKLPIVNVTIQNLERRIESLIADIPRCLDLGQKGRAYVEAHHSDAKIAAQLLDIYASS